MAGEQLNTEGSESLTGPIAQERFERGTKVTKTLAEIFNFVITDEDAERYKENMTRINESDRRADEIERTTFIYG